MYVWFISKFCLKTPSMPSCKRIHLSFAWNQHPLSTDKICSKPTSRWCQKQLTVAFVALKTVHCFFVVEYPLENLLMPTGKLVYAHWQICWWCPLAVEDAHWLLLLVFSRLSIWKPLSISLKIFPLCQLKGETLLCKIFLSSPPFKCRSFTLVYSPVQQHESTIIYSQLAALCVIVCNCITEAIF